MFKKKISPPQIVTFVEKVEKYGKVREATDGNTIRRMHFACLRSKKSADTRL